MKPSRSKQLKKAASIAAERLGAIFSECGLLWLVFGLMDTLVKGNVPSGWPHWYSFVIGIGVALIFFGIIIEVVRRINE
jgi:hypothetical protein